MDVSQPASRAATAAPAAAAPTALVVKRRAHRGGGTLPRLHRAMDARIDTRVRRLACEPHRVAGRLGEAGAVARGVQRGVGVGTAHLVQCMARCMVRCVVRCVVRGVVRGATYSAFYRALCCAGAAHVSVVCPVLDDETVARVARRMRLGGRAWRSALHGVTLCTRGGGGG